MTELNELTWQKSSFSADTGSCVEMARLPDGSTAVRNSNSPDAGTLIFTPAEVSAWIAGAKAGEFDAFAD